MFQPNGNIINHVDTWNIVTTFDTPFWKQIDKLSEARGMLLRAHKRDHIKTNFSKTLLNDRIDSLISHLEDLEASSSTQSVRPKRALFRFGSTILKLLYGNPDADDADYYNHKFQELNSNQEKQAKFNNYNLRLASNLLDIMERNEDLTNANWVQMHQSAQKLEIVLTNLTQSILHDRALQEFRTLELYFDSVYSRLRSEICLLKDDVIFAQGNLLHLDIINEKTLRATLASIKLDHDRKWISNIASDDIQLIFQHCKLETYHLKGNFCLW